MIAHDNPYSFILNESPTSLLQIEGAKDVAIELNSMSKSHNMAGWRMGMLASNPTMIEWILKVKSNIDSGQFRPMMLAAVKGLEADKSWYDTLNATYARRRAVAEEVMTALGCTFDPTQRGLFLWGRIADSESGSEAVADRALYESRVFVTPASYSEATATATYAYRSAPPKRNSARHSPASDNRQTDKSKHIKTYTKNVRNRWKTCNLSSSRG